MSDERAAHQVLAKYVRGVDARDGAAVAALFTETGRVEISYNNSGRLEPLGELVGQDAIAAAVSQMMQPHPAHGWSHHTTHDTLLKRTVTMRRSMPSLLSSRCAAKSGRLRDGLRARSELRVPLSPLKRATIDRSCAA